jgi:Tol biopolymer transport system component
VLLGWNVYARDLTTGRTELISADAHGCPIAEGADQAVTSSVSADGRYVAFTSGAQLVPGLELGAAHQVVYVRDRVRRRTVAVSVGYDGKLSNADAESPAISANGRYVLFESGASNLVPHDPWGRPDNLVGDLYVRDLVTGRTERVGSAHPRAHGIEKVNGSISDDGRWVAFETSDAALAPRPGPAFPQLDVYYTEVGPSQVFLYDRVTRRTRLASHTTSHLAGNSDSTLGRFHSAGHHVLSADGRFLVFQSDANNLLPGDPVGALRGNIGPDLDPADDIYAYDRVHDTLSRVTVGPGGLAADVSSHDPAISSDGRWIAFVSGAQNLGPVDVTTPVTNATTPSSGLDVYVHDRVTGTNELVSVSTIGVQGIFDAVEPAISGNGRVVAFVSDSPNLVVGDTNGLPDVFARRRLD